LASFSVSIGMKQAAQRSFASASRQQLVTSKLAQSTRARKPNQISSQQLRQTFRRGYADQISPATKEKAKKRSWGFLRWTWRLTYISALGGLAYMAWGIYVSRNPTEQLEQDPKKKTLVVLGT
jgi:NADH:ubiquinone reductase (non-electrogenic)